MAAQDQGTWQRNAEAFGTFFTEEEIGRLEAARGAIRPGKETIAYCTYENPFAKSGGVFTVADNYAAALVERGKRVVVLSPYHDRLTTAPKPDRVKKLETRLVPFGVKGISVVLYEHVCRGARWILLRADGFFDAAGGAARTDPYIHEDPRKLLTDSLLASAIIPHALAALGLDENVIVHVQDWELAPAALTVKEAVLDGVLKSAAVVLTSHNPYDHGLSSDALVLLTARRHHHPTPASSVYQCMIPLTDAPVNTVSENFARELTTDPLQLQYFADHLQTVFKNHGLIGVDDGVFGPLEEVYSKTAMRRMAKDKPKTILAEKKAKRKAMLGELGQYEDIRMLGGLDGGAGKPLAKLPDDVPVFFMFGRLDPGQKGFDVFARAIEAMPRGRARYVLAPIVAGAAKPYLDDLVTLGDTHQGEVAIYPFRMARGYMELMAGATYAVMPSLYEPFGAATEPYLSGTPVVARATGGLVQQVVDIGADPLHGTGLLFREDVAGLEDLGGQWKKVQRAGGPAERMEQPLYSAVVDALVAALTRACGIYQDEPPSYARMLSCLYGQAAKFSWDRTVRGYQAMYDTAMGE